MVFVDRDAVSSLPCHAVSFPGCSIQIADLPCDPRFHLLEYLAPSAQFIGCAVSFSLNYPLMD